MGMVINRIDSYQFRCESSVRYIDTDYDTSEFDKWDRLVFHLRKSSGYWSMKIFAPVKDGERVASIPLQVIHKYWEYYNELRK